jgi:hypothetical protein
VSVGPDLLRFWTGPGASIATFPGVAFDALAGSGGDAGASSAAAYGTVPKIEQWRKSDADGARQVRQGEKLNKLWNDMVDLGMIRQNGDGQWFVDPTAAPTATGGVTGHYN